MGKENYDIVIVGAGPCGLSVAAEAKKNNLKYIVLEKGSLAESVRNYPRRMTFFSTADNISVAGVPFTIDEAKATREQALSYYRKVVDFHKLNISLYDKVTEIKKQNNLFEVSTEKNKTYFTANVVLATGYFDIPRPLNVPGQDLPHVTRYYKEPYPYVFSKVTIVGGGNTAIETALSLYRHGADVTMIVRNEDFKPTAKYWLLPDIKNRVKDNSIKVRFLHDVSQITEDSVIIRNLKTGKDEKIPSDFVLLLIGYLADTKFLEKCNIRVEPGSLVPEYNRETFETNVKGIYLAGTVISGVHTEKVFIENGRLHAKPIIKSVKESLNS